MSWPPGSTGPSRRPLLALSVALSLAACEPQVELALVADAGSAAPPPRWVIVDSSTPVDLHAIAGSSASDIWAVGDRGLALRWNGTRWSPVPTHTTVNLSGVWAAAPNDAWAVGSGGPTGGPRILHWDGADWNPVMASDPFSPSAVWGSAPNDVWIIGDSPVAAPPLYHWNGNALIFERTPGGRPMLLSGVSGSGRDDVWLAGGMQLFHRGGNGDWMFPFSPPPRGTVFAGPLCATRSDVWLAVEGGSVLHGAGPSWSTSAPPTSATLRSLWCDREDVWALDGSARALRLRNGAWSTEALPSGDLTALWGAGGTLWAVGARGTILRRNP